MSTAALIRAMAAAGATPEAIAIAVEAIEARDAVEAERKAKRAQAKRDERARQAATVVRQSHDKGATVCDISPEVPPNDIYSNPPPTPSASPKASPSPKPRRRRTQADDGFHPLPADWKPARFGDDSAARLAVDRRGQPWAKGQLEDFRAWAANADPVKGKGLKRDWQQAFAKWINEHDREDRGGEGNRRSGNGAGRAVDGFGIALARAEQNTRPPDPGGADEHG